MTITANDTELTKRQRPRSLCTPGRRQPASRGARAGGGGGRGAAPTSHSNQPAGSPSSAPPSYASPFNLYPACVYPPWTSPGSRRDGAPPPAPPPGPQVGAAALPGGCYCSNSASDRCFYSSGSLSSSRRSCATDASAERSSSLSSLRRSSAAAAPTVRAYSSEHTVR